LKEHLMIRRVLCAVAVLTFAATAATADEFVGAIRKVEDGKISVAKFKKGEKRAEEPKSYKLASNVKILNAKFNREEKKVETGTPLEGGLKNERFKNMGKFGVFAQIITNADNEVTEIRVFPPFKFKKKSDD
jgi:hypothetical protein